CLRQQRNMTQEQLAMLLGVSRQSVAKWEAGQSTPEVDKLVKMADLFGCTLDELVSGDLSERPVSPAEVMPEGAPAEDVCGYDAHMRKFAFGIATGVALIVFGIAIALLADALLQERFSEAMSPATIIVFVAAGLAFILPAGVGHASFARAHPYVEDFYTPAQREAEQRSFARFLTAGIALILVGVVVVIATGVSENEQIQEIGAAALLSLVAGGVWCLVRGGIVHGMADVENYNRERADEQWERDNPQVGRVCGIIMLAATALGLLLLFGGMAASDAGNPGLATVCAYFWVVWPIGGIACGIASLAMKAAADK
ncbi:MAG: helix-turn-helix transcriptional regulator, partial [Eggerthellaceae bacterium]|nr:helix-turn-helix transcriptional regulator [Eggerthellaceae bacterium]